MSKFREFMKKYSIAIVDIVYYLYFVVAILIKVYYLQYTTKLNINDLQHIDANIITMKVAISIVLIIFSVVLFIFKKYRNGVLFAINLIVSIVFVADTLYFRYYGLPVSISQISQIGLIGDVTSSIFSLFKILDIVYVIDFPIYFLVIFAKKILKNVTEKKTLKRRYTMVVAIFLFSIGILRFDFFYSNVDSSMHFFDKNFVAQDLSILYYHYYDIKWYIKDEKNRNKPMTEEEKNMIEAYFSSKDDNKEESNKNYTGIAKDRNLIVIQLEALQGFAVENEINGQEITPFINSLIKESIYFDNIYNQVAVGNTSDAEFIFNNSLYPIGSGAVYFRYPNNKYMSLPVLLKNSGYESYVAHANKPSFWNRQIFYNSQGFDKYYCQVDFNIDEEIGLGLSDESFYKQVFNMIDFSKKVYSFNISLSNHHPYYSFSAMDNLDVGKYSDKQLGCFFKGAKYSDSTLKTLFDILKEKGIYDNSIIVLYGDHSGIFEDQASDLCEFLNIEYNEYNWNKLQKVPVIIHIPGANVVERISSMGGQIDILPTIANLMNIEDKDMLGRDMLNLDDKDINFVVLRYLSVYTDEYMYSSSTKNYYDMETGEKIDAGRYEDDVNERIKILNISDTIIKRDYFYKRENME